MKRVFNIAEDSVDEESNDYMIEKAKKILVHFFGEKHKEMIWSTLDSADYVYYDFDTKFRQGDRLSETLSFESRRDFNFLCRRKGYNVVPRLLENYSNEQLEEMKNGELSQKQLEDFAAIVSMYVEREKSDDETLNKIAAQHKDEIIDYIVSNRHKIAEHLALRKFFRENPSTIEVSDKWRRGQLLKNLLPLFYGSKYNKNLMDSELYDKLFEIANIYRTFKDEKSLNVDGIPEELKPGIIDIVKVYASAEEHAKRLIEDFKARSIEDIYESDFVKHLVDLAQQKGKGVDGIDVGQLVEAICQMTLYTRGVCGAAVYFLGDTDTMAYKVYCTLFKYASTRTKIHELMHVIGLKVVADPDRKDLYYVVKNGISINGRANAMNECLTDYFACGIDLFVKNSVSKDLLPLGVWDDRVKGYEILFPLVYKFFNKYEDELKEAYVGDELKPILDKVGKEKFYDFADSLDVIYELTAMCDEDTFNRMLENPQKAYEKLVKSGEYSEIELGEMLTLSENIAHVQAIVNELTSLDDEKSSSANK